MGSRLVAAGGKGALPQTKIMTTVCPLWLQLQLTSKRQMLPSSKENNILVSKPAPPPREMVLAGVCPLQITVSAALFLVGRCENLHKDTTSDIRHWSHDQKNGEGRFPEGYLVFNASSHELYGTDLMNKARAASKSLESKVS